MRSARLMVNAILAAALVDVRPSAPVMSVRAQEAVPDTLPPVHPDVADALERPRTRARHGNGSKFTFACGAREKARLALRAVRCEC